jgi:hypothetical protein
VASARPQKTYSVLQFVPPGGRAVTIGVIVFDPVAPRLVFRLREDLATLSVPGDAEVLAGLSEDLYEQAKVMGAEALMLYLEDTLSNAILISERRPIPLDGDADVVADELFRTHAST